MAFGDKPKLEYVAIYTYMYMTANHVSQWVDTLFSFCRYDQHVSSQVCSLVLCVALCWRCSYSSSSLVRMIILPLNQHSSMEYRATLLHIIIFIVASKIDRSFMYLMEEVKIRK